MLKWAVIIAIVGLAAYALSMGQTGSVSQGIVRYLVVLALAIAAIMAVGHWIAGIKRR